MYPVVGISHHGHGSVLANKHQCTLRIRSEHRTVTEADDLIDCLGIDMLEDVLESESVSLFPWISAIRTVRIRRFSLLYPDEIDLHVVRLEVASDCLIVFQESHRRIESMRSVQRSKTLLAQRALKEIGSRIAGSTGCAALGVCLSIFREQDRADRPVSAPSARTSRDRSHWSSPASPASRASRG